jgi:hypothetical protein
MGIGFQGHAPVDLHTGKRPDAHSTEGRVGPQGWSGWVQKISFPPGLDPRPFHLVASRNAD